MRALLEAILDLPRDLVRDRPFFERLLALTPDLPLEADENGRPVLAPAARYRPEEHNVEPVGLYAVYPFRCQTWYKGGHQPALGYYSALKKAGARTSRPAPSARGRRRSAIPAGSISAARRLCWA